MAGRSRRCTEGSWTWSPSRRASEDMHLQNRYYDLRPHKKGVNNCANKYEGYTLSNVFDKPSDG